MSSRVPWTAAQVRAVQSGRPTRSSRAPSARAANPVGPDADEIHLSLPAPPSVNATRRIDKAGIRAKREWIKHCDGYVYADGGVKRLGRIPGTYEAQLILDPNLTRLDIDNAIKNVLDYVSLHLELVTDDSPKYLRRVVIEFDTAPRGCRVVLRPFN